MRKGACDGIDNNYLAQRRNSRQDRGESPLQPQEGGQSA